MQEIKEPVSEALRSQLFAAVGSETIACFPKGTETVACHPGVPPQKRSMPPALRAFFEPEQEYLE